jgi:hypothetical protein
MRPFKIREKIISIKGSLWAAFGNSEVQSLRAMAPGRAERYYYCYCRTKMLILSFLLIHALERKNRA